MSAPPPSGNDKAADAGRGFEFPGSFEITVIGNADAGIDAKLVDIIRSLDMHVIDASVRSRASGQGTYVSVSAEFTCPSREKLQALHAALRADDDIHYTH